MTSESQNSSPKTRMSPKKIDTQTTTTSNTTTVEINDVAEKLFPDSPPQPNSPRNHPESIEEEIISIPGSVLHLIDRHYSVQLAYGDFSIMQLRQGDSLVAIFARVGNEIQWPLSKDDQGCVKLDSSHYFFSFRAPKEHKDDKDDLMLNYGLTFTKENQEHTKEQEKLLKELDELLDHYTGFSEQNVDDKNGASDHLKSEEMQRSCSAYWTTLAPNVEDYSGTAAKLIAVGSGQLVKGILWSGDVTVDRLKRGNEILKMKLGPCTDKHISPETLKRIQRVKKVTKMTEKVAGGILSGVLKISGYFASSVTNSKLGKKFFRFLPGEMALATLDGFSKVCEAFEVSGKNVMTTSSTVTTDLVSHKYGEEAAKATNEGLDAAGHAVGAAWTVFKIRTAVNPRSVVTPTALTKSGLKKATDEMKTKAINDMKAKEAAKEAHKKPKKSKRRCCRCCM